MFGMKKMQKQWAEHKAMESCFGENMMKTSLLDEEGCCKMYRNGHARTRSSNVQIPTQIRPRHARQPPRHGTNEGYGSLEEHATIVWTTTTTRFTTRPRWTTTTSPKRRYVQENDDENDVEENVQRRLIKPLRKHGIILI